MDLKIALQRYREQKNLCLHRVDVNGDRILMKLTFEEWCDIWETSGYWDLRGAGKGCYCMSRHNDIGHYEIGNVVIKTFVENIRESTCRLKHTNEAKKRMSELNLGEGNGMYGRKHSPKSRQKIKDKRALQDMTHLFGRTHSDETKHKQSEKAKQRPFISCPYCGKSVQGSNFTRWHGDNCKLFSIEKPTKEKK